MNTTDPFNDNAATDRVRDLNERILAAGKTAGNSYLDTYEKALESIASYQAKAVDYYVSAGRELLK